MRLCTCRYAAATTTCPTPHAGAHHVTVALVHFASRDGASVSRMSAALHTERVAVQLTPASAPTTSPPPLALDLPFQTLVKTHYTGRIGPAS